MADIVAACRTHPRAALRFLAMRFPERWGPEALESDEPERVVAAPSFATAIVTLSPEWIPESSRQLIDAQRAKARSPRGE